MGTHCVCSFLLIAIISSVLPRGQGLFLPNIKEGCPPYVLGARCLGKLDDCTYDSDCLWGHKCCENGCGRVCTKVKDPWIPPFPKPPIPKPPKPLSSCPIYMMSMRCPDRFNDECFSDIDCGWNEMCCDNRCGKTCMKKDFFPLLKPVTPHLPLRHIYTKMPFPDFIDPLGPGPEPPLNPRPIFPPFFDPDPDEPRPIINRFEDFP